MRSQNQEFTTMDIHLASALVALDFPLAGIEALDERKRLFVFNSSPDLSQAVEDFWDADSGLAVHPRLLLEASKNLKSKMWSLPNN